MACFHTQGDKINFVLAEAPPGFTSETRDEIPGKVWTLGIQG